MPPTGNPESAAARGLKAALLALGLACCLASCKAKPAAVPAPAAAPAGESFYDLDEFLVNLSNPEGDRYVRTTISLGFTHELERDAIKAQLPKVRDAIISVLGAQDIRSLSDDAGREKVKRLILDRLVKILPEAGFDGVYFQLFTFQ